MKHLLTMMLFSGCGGIVQASLGREFREEQRKRWSDGAYVLCVRSTKDVCSSGSAFEANCVRFVTNKCSEAFQ